MWKEMKKAYDDEENKPHWNAYQQAVYFTAELCSRKIAKRARSNSLRKHMSA